MADMILRTPTYQCLKCGFVFNIKLNSPDDIMKHQKGLCKDKCKRHRYVPNQWEKTMFLRFRFKDKMDYCIECGFKPLSLGISDNEEGADKC